MKKKLSIIIILIILLLLTITYYLAFKKYFSPKDIVTVPKVVDITCCPKFTPSITTDGTIFNFEKIASSDCGNLPLCGGGYCEGLYLSLSGKKAYQYEHCLVAA